MRNKNAIITPLQSNYPEVKKVMPMAAIIFMQLTKTEEREQMCVAVKHH